MRSYNSKPIFLFNIITSYCREYDDVLSFARTEDYTYINGIYQWKAAFSIPSLANRIIQNSFMKGIKDDAILSNRDVLWSFILDGDSDFKCINWVSPGSFQCTKVNSPTFATGGVTGGPTIRLNTNWIPNTNGVNFTQNSANLIVDVNTNLLGTGGMIDAGCSNTSNNNAVSINARSSLDSFSSRINDNITLGVANTNSIGYFEVARTAAAVRNSYKAGVSVASDTQASVTPSSNALAILCNNENGTFNNFSTRQIRLVTAGGAMTNLHDEFNTRITTYNTAAGL